MMNDRSGFERKTRPRSVVVAGAGYAGVIAANRLRASFTADEGARVTVTVVNPTADFVERIRLHQVAAGSAETASSPLSDVLHAGVRVVVGDVVRIDAAANSLEVSTAEGVRTLEYDELVYAVGSRGDSSVAGVKEHAFVVADADGAARARAAIAEAGPAPRISVVGGGLTAIETASEIAEHNPEARVTIVGGGLVAGSMRPSARRSILHRLARLGVAIHEGVSVGQVLADRLEFDDGTALPTEVCVWAASFSVPKLASVSGLPTDERGRLRVDENLRCIDWANITGAGDAVTMLPAMGQHVTMGCASALAQGGDAAVNVLAALRGLAPTFVSTGYLLQCVSLGRRNGYIQFTRSNGSPRALAISGRLGAMIKEAVCAMTVTALQKERKHPGAYWTPRGPELNPATPVGATR